MTTQWFLTRDGETIAQYSTERFKRAVARGAVRPTDYVRRSDSSSFIIAADFLPKPYKKSRSGAWSIVAAGLTAVAAVAAAAVAIPSFLPADMHAVLQGLQKLEPDRAAEAAVRQAALRQALLSDANGRFFKVLAEKDPAAFDALLAQISDGAGSETLDELIPRARELLMKTVVEPRSRYLDDADKAAMLTLGRDVGAHLATTNPKMCIAHALGRPFGDMRPFISTELIAREEALMLKMLDATPQNFDLRPAGELQALNTKVAMTLYQTHGDKLSLLDLENVPQGQEEAACVMFGAYLDGVLKLPEPERIALVRAIVLDPGRLTGESSVPQTDALAPEPSAAAPGAGHDATAAAPTDAPPPTEAMRPSNERAQQ